MLREFRDLIPKLELALTKGQSGRIGIIGGSEEYTGAPYFAAIASLRTGADLCHVFCAKEAARVIKSYSPELIVHSSFHSDQETLSQTILDQICRLDMLVIGPGLGRNVKTITVVMSIISTAREHKMPLIIDADGLFIVAQNPNMIKGYEKCIITPNVVELGRLKRALGISDCLERLETCKQISSILNVTVLSKGNSDIIVTGDDITINNSNGIPRRCGGQGDLLVGCLATFYNWGLKSNAESEIKHSIPHLCAYGASILLRDASFNAFQIHKRSMVASDIIQHIPISFQKLFEHDTK